MDAFDRPDEVIDFNLGLEIIVDQTLDQRKSIRRIEMDSTHTLLSAVVTFDPSPDWFTGFSSFDAVDGGTWLKRFTIETFPFDAGTQEGDSYSGPSSPQSPPENIFRITETTSPESTGVFLSSDNSTVLPVLEWSCRLETEETTNAPTNSPTFTPPTISPTITPAAPNVTSTPTMEPPNLQTNMTSVPTTSAPTAAPFPSMATNPPTKTPSEVPDAAVDPTSAPVEVRIKT